MTEDRMLVEGADGVGIRGPNLHQQVGEGGFLGRDPKEKERTGEGYVVLSRWTKVSGRGQLDVWAVPSSGKGSWKLQRSSAFIPTAAQSHSRV